jgi:hypothetical protein
MFFFMCPKRNGVASLFMFSQRSNANLGYRQRFPAKTCLEGTLKKLEPAKMKTMQRFPRKSPPNLVWPNLTATAPAPAAPCPARRRSLSVGRPLPQPPPRLSGSCWTPALGSCCTRVLGRCWTTAPSTAGRHREEQRRRRFLILDFLYSGEHLWNNGCKMRIVYMIFTWRIVLFRVLFWPLFRYAHCSVLKKPPSKYHSEVLFGSRSSALSIWYLLGGNRLFCYATIWFLLFSRGVKHLIKVTSMCWLTDCSYVHTKTITSS